MNAQGRAGGGVWRYRPVAESLPYDPSRFQQHRGQELEQHAPLFAQAGGSI